MFTLDLWSHYLEVNVLFIGHCGLNKCQRQLYIGNICISPLPHYISYHLYCNKPILKNKTFIKTNIARVESVQPYQLFAVHNTNPRPKPFIFIRIMQKVSRLLLFFFFNRNSLTKAGFFLFNFLNILIIILQTSYHPSNPKVHFGFLEGFFKPYQVGVYKVFLQTLLLLINKPCVGGEFRELRI